MLTSTRLLNIRPTPVPDQTCIPPHLARKFPALEVRNFDHKLITLPVESNPDPKATLLCLSLHKETQDIHTWSDPFHQIFNNFRNVHIYEVLFKDSKMLDYDIMRKKWLSGQKKKQRTYLTGSALQRHCVYSFGGRNDIEKKLKTLNAMIGSLFLLDNFGLVRWQGHGRATREGLSSLRSCTDKLLEIV